MTLANWADEVLGDFIRVSTPRDVDVARSMNRRFRHTGIPVVSSWKPLLERATKRVHPRAPGHRAHPQAGTAEGGGALPGAGDAQAQLALHGRLEAHAVLRNEHRERQERSEPQGGESNTHHEPSGRNR